MSFHIGTTSEIHFGTFYTFEPSLQILGYVWSDSILSVAVNICNLKKKYLLKKKILIGSIFIANVYENDEGRIRA